MPFFSACLCSFCSNFLYSSEFFISDCNCLPKDDFKNFFKKDNPKSSNGNIIRAIKNNRNCANYKWSYIKSNIIKPYTELDLKPIKIAQYDLNHNLIKIWKSVADCKEEFPSCQKVCRKERKSTNNFIFEYIS